MGLIKLKNFTMRGIEINGATIYTRNNPDGFGHEIMRKTLISVKPNGFKNHHYERLFWSYNRDLVDEVYKKITETETIPNIWPDTSNEIPPIRILRFEAKHHNYHFDASTPEKLERAARYILMDIEKGSYYPPDEPKNNSGINNLEELSLVGIQSLKDYTEMLFRKYQQEYEVYLEQKESWDKLQLILNGKGDLDDIMDVLVTYEHDNWKIIDLDEIE